MSPTGNTFPKNNRLCSRKAIEALFAGGNRSLSAFPLRAVYRVIDGTQTQLLVSVSKRHFKHAVDRNRAKRQMREAWRLNRHILLTNEHGSDEGQASTTALQIAFIWLADEPQPSVLVHRKMKNLLHRISEQCGEASRKKGVTDAITSEE